MALHICKPKPRSLSNPSLIRLFSTSKSDNNENNNNNNNNNDSSFQEINKRNANSDSKPSGNLSVDFEALREGSRNLSEALLKFKLELASEEKANKLSSQGLDILGQLNQTRKFMMHPPMEHLVEKDNMSLTEKIEIELAKVRKFQMSESDCGSARVQDLNYNLAGQSGDRLEVQMKKLLEVPQEERDWMRHLSTNVEEIQREDLMNGGFELPNPKEVMEKAFKFVVDPIVDAPVDLPGSSQMQTTEIGSSRMVLDEEGKTLTFTIPVSASTYSDSPSMGDLANSFLFPEDHRRLNELGNIRAADWGVSRALQVLTSSLYLRQTLAAQDKRNKDLANTNASLRKQAAKAVTKEKEWKAKHDEMKVALEASEAKLEAEKKKSADLFTCLEYVATGVMVKTQTDPKTEYKADQHTEWDLDSDIDTEWDSDSDIDL